MPAWVGHFWSQRCHQPRNNFILPVQANQQRTLIFLSKSIPFCWPHSFFLECFEPSHSDFRASGWGRHALLVSSSEIPFAKLFAVGQGMEGGGANPRLIWITEPGLRALKCCQEHLHLMEEAIPISPPHPSLQWLSTGQKSDEICCAQFVQLALIRPPTEGSCLTRCLVTLPPSPRSIH